WILSRLSDSINAYNIVNAFSITGELDIQVLNKAIGTLIERHEILRTQFKWEREMISQQVYAAEISSFTLKVISLPQWDAHDGIILSILDKEGGELFSFEEGKALFRATLICTNPGVYVLLFVV